MSGPPSTLFSPRMYRTGSLAIRAAPAASPIRIPPPSVGKNTAVGSVSDPG